MSYDYALDPKGIYRYTFKPAARQAEFPELERHELRHTFATLALESGTDLSEPSGSWATSHQVTGRVRPPAAQGISGQRAAFSAHLSADRAGSVVL